MLMITHNEKELIKKEIPSSIDSIEVINKFFNDNKEYLAIGVYYLTLLGLECLQGNHYKKIQKCSTRKKALKSTVDKFEYVQNFISKTIAFNLTYDYMQLLEITYKYIVNNYNVKIDKELHYSGNLVIERLTMLAGSIYYSIPKELFKLCNKFNMKEWSF